MSRRRERSPLRSPRRSRSRSPLRMPPPRSRHRDREAPRPNPRKDQDPWTRLQHDDAALLALRERASRLPQSCLALHEVLIHFSCGCRLQLDVQQATQLRKLECSLERAIAGEMRGGVSFEAFDQHNGVVWVRALVDEPTPKSFSSALFRLLSRPSRVEITGLVTVLEAKAAAEYWAVKSTGSPAITMLTAVTVAVTDFFPCDPELIETGMWDPECGRVHAESVRGLAFTACLEGLAHAQLITEAEHVRMEAIVVELEAVVTDARRRRHQNRYGDLHPGNNSPNTERKCLLAMQIFAALHKCVLSSVLPATSAGYTDIVNGVAVGATLEEDKEGKGGEHATQFARSCRQLRDKLKHMVEVTKAETTKWQTEVDAGDPPVAPHGYPQF